MPVAWKGEPSLAIFVFANLMCYVISWQIITTGYRGVVIPNGGLVREFPQNPRNIQVQVL